jgi:murein DD-endopeptidase MepM/ murein hydrolase activator NlpD
MRKLANPFTGNDTGSVIITQTYHAGGNNIAVDMVVSGMTSNTPIYALSDGTVILSTSQAGSYLYKSVDNENFFEYYVHTARWVVPNGTHVTRGTLLGYIGSQAETGYVEHLHMGLTTGYYLMDYISRDIVFSTPYQDIANEWFDGSTSNPIDWSNFQNLYINQGGTPPVPPIIHREGKFPWVLYARKLREQR